MLKNKFYYLFIFLVTLSGSCYFWLHHYLTKPISNSNKIIQIETGDSSTDIARKLVANKIDINPSLFKLYTRITGKHRLIQVGEYSITPNMSFIKLYENIISGKVIQHDFTIMSGWNFKDLMENLTAVDNVKSTLVNKTPEEIMFLIQGIYSSPEGLFYPDTYFYVSGTTDLELLTRAYHKLQQVLDQELEGIKLVPPIKNKYELLTLASIIEKETSLEEELRLVSGVYHNRLVQKIRLQADPTVVYALKDKYQGKLYRKHLRYDSYFNTYKYHGLPPTPIAFSSLGAIRAAINPDLTDYLYFVADGSGGHVFSKTYDDHLKAIALVKKKSSNH